MTDFTEAFMSHNDTCRCIGISLDHLDEHDKHTIDCCYNGHMAGERDTGWFVKLYDYNASDDGESLEAFYKSVHRDITPTLLNIFCAAYHAGYRMIEFDVDAGRIDGLPTFD